MAQRCVSCGRILRQRTTPHRTVGGLFVCDDCANGNWPKCHICGLHGEIDRTMLRGVVDAQITGPQQYQVNKQWICVECAKTKTRTCPKCKQMRVSTMFKAGRSICSLCMLDEELCVATNPQVTERDTVEFYKKTFQKLLEKGGTQL